MKEKTIKENCSETSAPESTDYLLKRYKSSPNPETANQIRTSKELLDEPAPDVVLKAGLFASPASSLMLKAIARYVKPQSERVAVIVTSVPTVT